MTIQIILGIIAASILYMVTATFRFRTRNNVFAWLPVVAFIIVEFRYNQVRYMDNRFMFLTTGLTYCVLHIYEAYSLESRRG